MSSFKIDNKQNFWGADNWKKVSQNGYVFKHRIHFSQKIGKKVKKILGDETENKSDKCQNWDQNLKRFSIFNKDKSDTKMTDNWKQSLQKQEIFQYLYYAYYIYSNYLIYQIINKLRTCSNPLKECSNILLKMTINLFIKLPWITLISKLLLHMNSLLFEILY